MTKEKYFSVDVSNDIHIVNLHDTEEQARKSCLDCANEAYEFAGDLDDFENYIGYDLPYAVYGVILGRAKSDTRHLTNDELESGYYDEKSHFIEPPELIKVNNFNNWISVKDRLPEITDHKGFMRSDVVLGFGKEEKDETVPTYSLVYVISGNRFYSGNGECYQITHWQPLAPPPTND